MSIILTYSTEFLKYFLVLSMRQNADKLWATAITFDKLNRTLQRSKVEGKAALRPKMARTAAA